MEDAFVKWLDNFINGSQLIINKSWKLLKYKKAFDTSDDI